MNTIKRGEIYCADLDPVVGSEQGGIRPVLVIQNDIGNRYSPTVIVLAITSQLRKSSLPTHVEIPAGKTGLPKTSLVLAEQMRTLEKQRLQNKMGELSPGEMIKVDQAIRSSLGFEAMEHCP